MMFFIIIRLPIAKKVDQYYRTQNCILFLFASGITLATARLNLGVRVQESSRHTHTNKEPSLRRNDTIKDQITQKCHGDLVDRSDNGVRRRPSGRHATQRGKIQQESNQTGKDVFRQVVGRMQGRRRGEDVDLSHGHGHGQQEAHAQDVVVKDHAKLGKLDVLRGKFHVENVTRRRQAVQTHPEETSPRHVNVIPSGGDGAREHNGKGDENQFFHRRFKEVKVTETRNNVGKILEDGNHGNRVVLKRGHSGEEHEAKENIDGGPLLGRFKTKTGVFDPLEPFATFDGDDGHDGLEDDQ